MTTSLETALLDSLALREVAERAGITDVQAARVCAALYELPARQLLRVLHTAASRVSGAKLLSSSKPRRTT